jgi:hypothetical protein
LRRIPAALGAVALCAAAVTAAAGDVEHDAVHCVVAGTFPRFEARYRPPEQASSVRLFFRAGSGGDWYYVPMTRGGERFVGVLPKPKSDLGRRSYYIEVTDTSFGSSRTQERSATVVASGDSCQGRLAGGAGSVASILVGRVGETIGGPVVPAGFSSANVVAIHPSAAATASSATGAGGGSGGAAVAAGAAAAAGGGISATTVGLVTAAVAGGAVAAVKLSHSDSGGDSGVFTGAFSGDLTMDFGGCTRLERHSGTLRLQLEAMSGSLTGSTAEIEGLEAVVSSQCSGGPQAGFSQSSGMPSTPVTGSLSGLAFGQEMSNRPPAEPTLTVTTAWRFSGSGDSSRITGVLTKNRSVASPGNPTASGSMTVPVTLTRQ